MMTGSDLTARLDALDVPGAGALVLCGRRIVSAMAGRRVAGRAESVRAGDRWHIGSCTKAMTATVLARLTARGAIDMDGTLGAALPDLSMHPAFAAMPLARVLRHGAGIRRDPHWSTFVRLRQSRAGLREQRRHLTALALSDPPLRKGGYSNLGYIVLGAVIEAATGMPWERVMAREVFAPLGMDGATFGAPALPAPVGHAWEDGRWRAKAPGPWSDNPRAYGPAGRVCLSLEDWARFASVHLGAGPAGYLSSDMLTRLHRPGESGYAAGWAVGHLPDGAAILRHTGSNTLWFAEMRLVPARGVGVGIVCNAYGPMVERAVGRMAEALLADALALPKGAAMR